ncbi:MAG: hypothetical protein HKN42_19525 [Granulosicoccus sp.]|nr:hypothetical protein [Granulosicoccus sp.]
MLIVLLSSCGGSSGDADGRIGDDDPNPFDPDLNSSCDVAYQNQWLYNNMLDYYLFYDQVPVVTPQDYASPEELLRAIRFQERDPFSHVTAAAESELQFAQGREFGLGYRWRFDDLGNARIAQTVAESPFGQAGISRGDIIRGVDGLAWDDPALDEGFIERVFGTPEAPATATWQIEDRATGDVVELQITAAEYAINTVEAATAYTHPFHTGKVGYFVFNRFLSTSERELQDLFTSFNDAGVTDLVVDLRYNGGGRVYIAEILASMIGGETLGGKLLYSYQYNDKYQENNYDLRLLPGYGDLSLSRVVFLTQRSTASASEIVISGLAPHMEVINIGSVTSGKPYVQRGRDRCDLRLNAVEAEGINAAGVSVFGGVPATCFAADDITSDFGIDEDGFPEGMLAAALNYLTLGSCEVPVTAKGSAREMDQAAAIDQSSRQGFSAIGGAIR